jgi:carotenoid cleavage dioxygenase-like enzyme
MSEENVFFWWPDKDGNAPVPKDIRNELMRFTFDPRSSDLDIAPPEMLLAEDCEFPRIDDRYHTKEHSHVFLAMMDPELGTDFAAMAPVMGGGYPPYNSVGHFDHKTKTVRKYFPGKMHLCQEPVFIPRSQDAAEGDGWVVGLVNNYVTMLSELHIVDTAKFDQPCAIISLPVRLRAGLHGNWVDAQDLGLVD